MKSVPKKPRSSLFIRLWVSVITSFLVAGVLGILILLQGRVSGVEFSPTHFQQRTFEFYEIPIIEQQITPIRRKTVNNPALNFIRTNGYITTSPGLPNRWDLVSLTRGLTGTTEADAELLFKPLVLEKDDAVYWETWSKQNPAAAGFLWPIIQKLALRELYLFIPPLLEKANQIGNSSDFQSDLEMQLISDYLRLAGNVKIQGKNEIAEEMLKEAGQDFPELSWPQE